MLFRSTLTAAHAAKTATHASLTHTGPLHSTLAHAALAHTALTCRALTHAAAKATAHAALTHAALTHAALTHSGPLHAARSGTLAALGTHAAAKAATHATLRTHAALTHTALTHAGPLAALPAHAALTGEPALTAHTRCLPLGKAAEPGLRRPILARGLMGLIRGMVFDFSRFWGFAVGCVGRI